MHHCLGAGFRDRGRDRTDGPAGAVTADQTTSGRVDLENGDSTIITEQTALGRTSGFSGAVAVETGDFEVSAVVAVDNQIGTSGWVCDLYADNPGDPTGPTPSSLTKRARQRHNPGHLPTPPSC